MVAEVVCVATLLIKTHTHTQRLALPITNQCPDFSGQSTNVMILADQHQCPNILGSYTNVLITQDHSTKDTVPASGQRFNVLISYPSVLILSAHSTSVLIVSSGHNMHQAKDQCPDTTAQYSNTFSLSCKPKNHCPDTIGQSCLDISLTWPLLQSWYSLATTPNTSSESCLINANLSATLPLNCRANVFLSACKVSTCDSSCLLSVESSVLALCFSFSSITAREESFSERDCCNCR